VAIAVRNMRCPWSSWRQAHLDGETGEVFPGPATFGDPATAQNYRQSCFRWLLSDIKYSLNPFSGRAPPRIPVGKLTTLPRLLVGWCGDTPPKFPSSISAPTEWGGDRDPREWFHGSRCGCRWAWLEIERTSLLTAYIVIDEVSIWFQSVWSWMT